MRFRLVTLPGATARASSCLLCGASLFGALLLAGALLCACGKPKGSAGSGSATSAASAAGAPSAAPGASVEPSATPKPPAPDPVCRVLGLKGEGKAGDASLSTGSVIDGSSWVTLDKDASLTLKHAASGREIGVAGPALFRACLRGREQVLLARGKVTGVTGMGARPGAEVLIATPLGAFRYGDADFVLSVDERQLSVEVRTGPLEVDPANDKPLKGAPSGVLRAKDKLRIPLGKPDPHALMARCGEKAAAAEASARKLAQRDAPEPLGERAKAHVEARKAARAACTVAAAASGLVADPEARAGLWAEATRWEGLWETIPRRGTTSGPEK